MNRRSRHRGRLHLAVEGLLVLALSAVTRPGWSEVIPVPAGSDLQAAIDRAQPGDTVLLAPGSVYVGNFTLPAKPGSRFIVIRTGGRTDRLPGPGRRVVRSHLPLLATLKSPNGEPALRTLPGAHHWRLELLAFAPTAGGAGDIVRLGDGAERRLDAVPHNLVIDRCYIQGDPIEGQRRGIALNSASTAIIGSSIVAIKRRGDESQAIAGWNGPGPFVVENNYLEAAGENFLLGGADSAISGLVPSDVTFRGNHLAKPLAWRGEKWVVKNLFELKNARRVLVEGCLFEKVWADGQAGYAIVLTPRNSGGAAPWSTVEDVTFRYNVVRHAGGGVNILGRDDTDPSGQARAIRIADNLFDDLDRGRWGGAGHFLLLGDGPSEIVVEHNTVLHSGNVIEVYGGTRSNPAVVERFVFRDNLARHNANGVHGSGLSIGNPTLEAYFPGALFTHNVLAGGRDSRYPAGNFFPSVAAFEDQFVDAGGGDYRLKPDSVFREGASDGRDLGADLERIQAKLGMRIRVRQPPVIKSAVPLARTP
jgi:hypothetical protein